MRVEQIPRRPDGTTDRGALLAVADLAGLRGGFAEPQGKVEAAVAGVWREVLNLRRVGRNDSFFDLAGDSIKATRLLSRVKTITNVSLSLHDLYMNNTVALMAERLHAAATAGQDTTGQGARGARRDGPVNMDRPAREDNAEDRFMLRKTLSHPGVLWFVGGAAVSTMGDFALFIAAGVWVKELTGSSAQA